MPVNKILLYLILSGSLQLTTEVRAQNEEFPESSNVSELFEELASSEIESSDAEEISEDLSHFAENPLNLNQAGEEDLRKLHLLNDFQIYTLLEYIREYGPAISINELQTIIGFSTDITRKLEPYIMFIPEQKAPAVHSRRVNQELAVKFASDLQKFKTAQDSSENTISYPGSNRSITSRYRIKSGKSWEAGMIMDQDPGESFKQAGRSFQPDFISAFAEINREGILNHLIIGDFRTSYGQGLVLSGYSPGKGTAVLKKPERQGIRKYSSTGENNLFRGAAIALKQENLSMDFFYSSLQVDATLYSDSCNYFKSLLTTGLHRNESELQKKDAVLLKSYGTHAGLKTGNLDLGLTFFSQNFNTDYLIKTNPFLSTRFKKNDPIWNISSDYKLNLNKVILFGEIASDYKGRLALLNGILAKLHPLISYSFIHRKYHQSYLGLRSGGFGEKSHTRNEEGYYTGIEIYPWKYLRIDIFADHYKFPFPDVLSTGPVTGNEYFLNCIFFPASGTEFNFRSRYEKKKEQTDRQGKGIDLTDASRKISNRFEFRFTVHEGFVLKSRTEFSYYKKSGSGWTKGYYSGNDIAYETGKKAFRFWMRYAVFDIPAWDNRIYAYENDILYSFSTPVYNSRGTRTIFLAKIILNEKAELWVRYSVTIYNGLIKSGNSDYPSKSNKSPYLSVQLRLKI
jgi:hypothetical protein